jgi:hypothetical protein
MAIGGSSGTANDLFVMAGSDFDRPGLVPRANYSIGIGHMFRFLKKDPFGDELTFGYMYENSGTHGFLHAAFGEHTESVGLMKNFPLPAVKRLTGYTWIQTGITTFTGNPRLQNRLDSSLLGVIGNKVLSEDEGHNQDFLLVNHPVLPFGNVASYWAFQQRMEMLAER